MLKIEVSGTDGAGKTTGLKYLIAKLKEKGFSVTETREVGNPHIPICVKLRELVLSPESNLSGEAMEMIFCAMRFENDKWMKTLNNTDFVVSDRGWLDHLAYTDHNVNIEFTDDLYNGVIYNRTNMPDIVIYFSVNTETALKRRVSRGSGMDAIEMKGVEYQEKVRKSFESYVDEELIIGDIGIYTVDANQTLEQVQSQLDNIANEIIANHFGSKTTPASATTA